MLAETLAEAGRRFGDRPALVAEDGWSLTYRQLDEISDEVAAGLVRRGVHEGDVVSLVLPAVPEHIVAYLAAAKVGAVTAAVNPKLAASERAAVLAAAGPRLVLATADLMPGGASAHYADNAGDSADNAEGSHRGPPGLVEVVPAPSPGGLLADLRRPGDVPPPLRSDPSRPVAIVFTSGTTGIPKGAVFCGSQIEFITRCDVGPSWGGGGKSLTGSALAHLGPMTKLAGNLKRGSTSYLTRTFRASDALRRISELGIAAVGGVPTQVALMLADPDFDTYDLRSVQAIIMGGGPATPALICEARRRFGVPVAVRYSCTEAGIGTGTAFDDPEEDAEVSVGRPQPGVTLTIIDPEGQPLSTIAGGGTGAASGSGGTDEVGGADEVGEVCLSSPAAMRGYWRDPGATAEAFTTQGAVRTGDLGWVDHRGRLHLCGRTRERYVRGGYNVHPMEVEAVLAEHPAVSAVVVVARSDPMMGEIGEAVVVATPLGPRGEPLTLESLRSFGSERLARYKLPDRLRVVEQLPLTAMDKVDRRALERLVAGDGSAGDGSAGP